MKLPRLKFLFYLIFLSFSATCVAQSWSLVTPEEMAAYSETIDQNSLGIRTSPVPLAPEILVEAPDLSKGVRTPTDIKMVFRSPDGTKIRPDSFRVTYGKFGFDITARVLSRYRPSEVGLKVADVGLPPGKHVLTLSIADSLGREGSNRIVFNVQPPDK